MAARLARGALLALGLPRIAIAQRRREGSGRYPARQWSRGGLWLCDPGLAAQEFLVANRARWTREPRGAH